MEGPTLQVLKVQTPRPQEAERLTTITSQLGMHLAVGYKMDLVSLPRNVN